VHNFRFFCSGKLNQVLVSGQIKWLFVITNHEEIPKKQTELIDLKKKLRQILFKNFNKKFLND